MGWIRNIGMPLAIWGAIIGAIIGGEWGCNLACNNRTLKHREFENHSFSTGISGHVEYTKYSDGSRDVKVYPTINTYESEFYQDLNGDGKVDRIRQNAFGGKMQRLNEILIRTHDYEANQERFDEADKRLQSLIAKFDN